MPWITRYSCKGCTFTVDISSEAEDFTPQRDEDSDCRYCPNCWSAYAFPRRVEKRFMQDWLSKRGQWRQRSTFRDFILKEIESQIADVELFSIFHFFLPTINCPNCNHELLSKLVDSTALWCIRCEQHSLFGIETLCHYQALEETL